MKIKEFINTIYLGDRWLKSIIVDSVNSKLKLQVNVISRIRSEDGFWNYYNDENIEDGFIVFTDVESLEISPQGVIPNDEICDYEVNIINDNASEVIFYIGSYDKNNNYTEAKLRLVAGGIYLEDPKQPNKEIRD
ncbi:DUF6258 family protein [Clostridium sp. UBA6640]|uniref:DUF6258 family protein n=1 Tax=Clostridium sp. UBA6640 TaxID=1946370 RepID=UPI0025C476BF|nr:DUF6258 family protein [Clostridium sp. UBA6640]